MEIAARPQPLEPPLAELVGIQFGLATAKDIVRRDNAALFLFSTYTPIINMMCYNIRCSLMKVFLR